MRKTLGEIAKLVGGEVIGDLNVVITGMSGIKEAKKGDITFVANSRYASLIKTTKASAIIVSNGIGDVDKPLIRTDDPYLAFTKVMKLLNGNDVRPPEGIHPTAVVGKGVRMGKGVSIQAYVVIGDSSEIGDNVVLHPHVTVGRKCKIGSETMVYPQVTVCDRVTVGKRVIIGSGTVIGSEGFGFAPVKGVHHKVPQVGTVVVEDDVEIGANVTIDRATIAETRIGKGTKIDNLVQIAHNVAIGENCVVVAQTGISGSATIKKGVTLAGQSGVVGHVTIGENSKVAGRAGVTKSIPPDSVVSGFPAKPHRKEQRMKAVMQKLPDLNKTILDMERRLEELEEKLN